MLSLLFKSSPGPDRTPACAVCWHPWCRKYTFLVICEQDLIGMSHGFGWVNLSTFSRPSHSAKVSKCPFVLPHHCGPWASWKIYLLGTPNYCQQTSHLHSMSHVCLFSRTVVLWTGLFVLLQGGSCTGRTVALVAAAPWGRGSRSVGAGPCGSHSVSTNNQAFNYGILHSDIVQHSLIT